jgi:Ca2+/H+ antiporter, TMEM165/GDT1 family
MMPTLIDWIHAGPVMVAAFFASAVEAVEAATIVLAAGVERGWRSSLAGALAGLIVLVAIVAVFGTAIAAIPIATLQVIVGALLLLFGIRWLRKAMLRSAGVIDLRDEEALYAREREALGASGNIRNARWDGIGILASFKAVLLEGIEVIVIVIGIGAAGNTLVPASVGAGAACIAVAAAAAMLNRPLARVPENTLKFTVGIMVSAFGLFWYGEGIGVHWPYGDATILGLMAVLLASSSVAVAMARRGEITWGP